MSKTQKISLGFSSCPNDTFIFDAMIHGKIDTEGLEFELFIGDVEELNRKAFSNELDITKISYNAYTRLAKDYVLMDSGSALGENCGPLIIANKDFNLSDLPSKSIAIPGVNTTANLLLSIAFPQVKNKQEMIFSDIEKSVLNGTVDAGLIIHESRFTYKEKGLKRIIDLGEYWEKLTNTPTPLGGIIAQRKLENEILQKINRVLKRSVQFAFDNPKSGLDFIKTHSQEMSEEVMYKHIGLYVNHYTLDLGIAGRKSVETLFAKAKELDLIDVIEKDLFLPSN
ncbi:MAG: 1,4-dihydroxy-6-naphthoate synthase [Bacteroidetes bacterium]|nr:MAG: 1,4-dihydroxy-6-naphthoate synthase [Bacteroidota bacterium]